MSKTPRTASDSSKDADKKAREEFCQQRDEDLHTFINDISEKPNKEKYTSAKCKDNSTGKAGTSRKITYTFQDMPECSKKSLEIIYHKPIYELPIPTNPKYKNLPLQERVQLLDNYYQKIRDAQSKRAKQSLYRAPYSAPILASSKCKNSLLKNPNDDNTFDEVQDQASSSEVYVSRAGRQIKRKIYAENNDSDTDFVSLVKKNKSVINSDTKITIDTPCTVEKKRDEDTSKPIKTKRDTVKSTPKLRKAAGRAEELFDKLVLQNEDTKRIQQEMELFEKTLSNVDSEDEIISSQDISKEENEGKSAKAKTESTQSKQEDLDSDEIVPGTPPDSSIPHHYMSLINKSAEVKRNRLSLKTNNSPEEKSEEPKRDCPLCGKEFPQSEIEHHASNCGNFEHEIENDPPKVRDDTPKPVKKGKQVYGSQDMFENPSTDKLMKQRQGKSDLYALYEDDSPIKDNNQEFSRRVPPPKWNFNKRGQRKNKPLPEDPEKEVSVTRSGKSAPKRNPRIVSSPSNENLLENTEVNKTACPICDKQFPQNEIEDHAATCENFEMEESNNEQTSNKIACELCDRVFLQNADYEVHVKRCIAAKVVNM